MKKIVMIIVMSTVLLCSNNTFAAQEEEQNNTITESETSNTVNSCPQLEGSPDNSTLDSMLKSTDDRLKTLVLTVDKDSKKIDAEASKLSQSFTDLYGFMKQGKDLRKNKQAILQKKDSASKQNDTVLADLEEVNQLIDSTKTELEEAYCSVGSLHQYYVSKAQTEQNKNLITEITTTRDELSSKVKMLNKIMDDFSKFFTQLDTYTQSIKTSSELLVEFANAVIAYENQTCSQKKDEVCTFKTSNIESLLSEQKNLTKMNEIFLKSKKDLLQQSLNWKLNDEK